MSLAHHSPHHSSGIAKLKMIGLALLVILIAMLVGASNTVAPDSDGEKIFKQVCTTCHSLDRPSDMTTEPLAPPMKMIMRHYIAAHDSDEAIHAALVSWLVDPAPERSALPAHAIENHGLMPAPNLDAEERTAVVDFLLTLDTESMSGGMQGMMKHQQEQDEAEGGEGCKMMQKKAEGEEGCKMMQGKKEGEKGHKMKMMKKKDGDS